MIFAITYSVAVATELAFKADIPKLLTEPIKLDSLEVLPNGNVMVGGNYMWSPDKNEWQKLQQGCGDHIGKIEVSPLNANQLLAKRDGGHVSDDGGTTWRRGFNFYEDIGGSRVQIGSAFWSIRKPDTVLLQDILVDKGTIFEMSLSTGKINSWSKTPMYFSRYERVGEKHFGWMGALDKMPPQCVVSEDDGKTWNPILPEETPWSLHAKAQAQRDKLVPLSKRPEYSRPCVKWAVEIGGVAFCRFECVVGEKFDLSLATLFTSSDHGKTWVAANLEKRTAEVRTLFGGSPFITKDSKGLPVINPNEVLQLRFDQKGRRVFAGLNGEWFVTTGTDLKWHRINHLKK